MTPAELKSARRALGLTQAEFARLIGLDGSDSGRTVRRWELGERAIPGTVVAIMRVIEAIPEVLSPLKERAGLV